MRDRGGFILSGVRIVRKTLRASRVDATMGTHDQLKAGGGDAEVGTPLILADDLSGAAETAAALGGGLDPVLFLWPELPFTTSANPVVIDLDSRELPPEAAGERVRAALVAVPDAGPVFKKIDSLLRGNLAAEVAPLMAAGTVVVLTPALPQQGRTVSGGVLFDHGVPLPETDLWALESADPPATVAAALGGLPVRAIDLRTVRSGGVARELAEATASVAVCDAETQADLDAIVTAGLDAGVDVRFVGSSALARGLGPHLERPSATEGTTAPASSGPVLYVLGTGSAAAVAQAERLQQASGAVRIPIDARELATLEGAAAAAIAGRLAEHLREGSVVVQVQPETGPRVAGAEVVSGLARLVVALLAAAPAWPVRLMLTGGQTARAVLDALGQRRLSLLQEVHPGAVLLTTADGALVATRPGSHGGPDSLVQIHHAMNTDSQ